MLDITLLIYVINLNKIGILQLIKMFKIPNFIKYNNQILQTIILIKINLLKI